MAVVLSEMQVEEIKARTDLADLVSSYGVQIHHVGATLKACCPFHNEKTPSFNINQTKGYYHCFGCGESGDAIAFVMKMEGLTFAEAAQKLANQCGLKLDHREDPQAALRKRLYTLMAELAAFYHRCLRQTKEAQIARDYLQKRLLDEKTQEDFLIGYAPNGITPILRWAEKYGFTKEELDAAGVIKPPTRDGDNGYHRFGGRLMFSIKDKQGRVVAFSGRQLIEKKNSGKYVNSPETPIFKKSNVLFAFDRAAGAIAKSPSREVICCEGQIDTIRLHTSGWSNAVASQGTAFTEEHAKMINRVADSAILMYDDDAAGHKATIRVARLLLAREMPVRVVSLPGGHDPDSFILQEGPDALKKCIASAESIISFQCQCERAKEENPSSIDAVSRVAKSVLTTLAMCPSAILRASLTDEASRLLSLPVAALTEELAKIKITSPTADQSREENDDENEIVANSENKEENVASRDIASTPIAGDTAERVTPPSARDIEFMAFLLANEYDTTIDAMAGEFLPANVFSHSFTERFVATWRDEIVSGEDRFATFAKELIAPENLWFNTILANADKSQASNLQTTDILKEFIRSLWCDALSRQRGALPAQGGDEIDMKRLKISMNLKRLQQVRWNLAKELIREIMKGDN